MPGQLGGKSGLLGTKWVSATGEVAGDPKAGGFSRSAADKRQTFIMKYDQKDQETSSSRSATD